MMRAASGQGKAVRATVRLTASEIIDAEVLPPILTTLRERYPQLEIEVVLSNSVASLLRRDGDIAVRTVKPAHEALVIKRIGTVTVGLHAQRRYLDRVGRPHTLDSLARCRRELPTQRFITALVANPLTIDEIRNRWSHQLR
jgi:DNA-binding transcriptional LysR family regulator